MSHIKTYASENIDEKKARKAAYGGIDACVEMIRKECKKETPDLELINEKAETIALLTGNIQVTLQESM